MRPIDADALIARLEDDVGHMEMPVAKMFTYGAINDIKNEPTITVVPLAPTPQWIPVSERLPDISKSVLICDIDGDIYLGYRTRYDYYYPAYGDDRIKNVTAWMPLPTAYTED